MKKDFFKAERFINLLLRNFSMNYKSWLIGLAAVVGIFIGIATLTLIFNKSDSNFWIESYKNQSTFAFMLIGLIFASTSFPELKSPAKSLQYLSLAASNFEKFLASYLTSTLVYIIASTAAYTFGSIIISLISMLFFSGSFQIFNPFETNFLNLIFIFVNLHAIFFLGSVYFKNYAFFKTILVMFIINIITNIWTAVWAFILFKTGDYVSVGEIYFNSDFFFDITKFETIKKIFISLWIIFSLFLITTAYIRFKEKEV